MFETSLDFFTSIFWFQLLDSVEQDGLFSKEEIHSLVTGIQDLVQEKATASGFDLSAFRVPNPARGDSYWDAREVPTGIRGKILFR